MARQLCVLVVILVAVGTHMPAQQFPPGFVDPVGSVGGTPTQKNLCQTHIVNGKVAWHMDSDGPPVAVAPELAEI